MSLQRAKLAVAFGQQNSTATRRLILCRGHRGTLIMNSGSEWKLRRICTMLRRSARARLLSAQTDRRFFCRADVRVPRRRSAGASLPTRSLPAEVESHGAVPFLRLRRYRCRRRQPSVPPLAAVDPLAMPPKETISSSPLLTVRLLTAPPFSTVIILRNNAVPPLIMLPDKTLIVASA
jgi:hypothetical protein